MLKIGVLGAGHLGKIHLKILAASKNYELIGFYDPDKKNAAAVVKEFGYTYFDSIEKLIGAVEVVNIVTPTLSHFDCAKKAIAKGKHLFIEKPIGNNSKEATEIQKLVKAANLKGQVGHIERFNPAFVACKKFINEPMFIETHRLASFNPRGTDVPVVLDLMIHDLDIMLSLINSPIKEVRASGVSIMSDTPDIANARIAFENGCVANLTASRISLKNMRKSRFFQRHAYISVDFLEKKSEVIKIKNLEAGASENPFAIVLENHKGTKKEFYFEHPAIKESNAMADELNSFARAIKNDTPPEVSLKDGSKALALAEKIMKEM